MLALVEGFAGYSLPDDLLSGTGLRAAEGFMRSIPVLGSYVSFFVFDGPFPGEAIIPRLYSVHVLLLPAILVGLFTAHIVLVAVQKHTQFPGPGRTNENVVGYPVMPVYAAKAGGFFFIVFGVIALMSALVTINPIWAYGPYDPSPVTAGSQPDWYMGFADGALRLLPGFLEFEAFGFTFSFNVMIGAILLIPVMYGLISIYPFVEEWVTGDKREHHLLDRPRNNPTRTAIGMAAISIYAVLMFAAGNDIMAIKLGLSINDITIFLRAAFFFAPPVVYWITKRICLSLQRRDRDLVLHGRETGRIIRTAEGRFYEKHEALDPYTRWNLVQHEQHQPLQLEAGTDQHGVASPTARMDRLRAKVSHFYFKDRVEPVSPAELEAAHHDGHHMEEIEQQERGGATLVEVGSGDNPDAEHSSRH
jgi:ubiquinol-cytochrome c reductase cytochrome b subunit